MLPCFYLLQLSLFYLIVKCIFFINTILFAGIFSYFGQNGSHVNFFFYKSKLEHYLKSTYYHNF